VHDSASHYLPAWSSFFVMTGSSAAALTGLMFVVISLVTGRENRRDGISTFSTPTVMHFAAVFLASAVLSAPWHRLIFASISVALIGLYGVAYILRVALGAKRLDTYHPDVEDWMWYTVLPFLAYGAIAAGSIALTAVPGLSLFAIGAGIVLLILIGVRNAWDVVTFLAISGPPGPQH
jgi:hypothetical protein